MTPPTAPERCTVCDRPLAVGGCPRFRASSATSWTAHEWKSAAFDCHAHRVDWRAAAAARLSEAAAIVAAEPGISGAELARRLGGIDPSYAARILADVRATVPDLPPAPPVVGGPGKVVRLRAATLARLAEATGRPVGEDVDGQVGDLLDRFATRNPARRGEE